MSQEGIKLAASVFSVMQEARISLVRMGVNDMGTANGNQDIALGQMFEDSKDAMKGQFTKLIKPFGI